MFSPLTLGFSLGISYFTHFSVIGKKSRWDGAMCERGGRFRSGGVHTVSFPGLVLSSEITLTVLYLGSLQLIGWGRGVIMHFHAGILPGFNSFPQLNVKLESFQQGKSALLIPFPTHS